MEELTQDQIAAELAAGYNDEDAVQDTVPEVEPEVEEKQEEVVEQEVEQDPWAGVPAALKAEFEALKSKASMLDNLAERLKQAEKRVGGLTNKLHEAEVAAKNAPTKEQIEAAAKDKEKMDALKEEWPEWAEALEKTEQRITEKLAGVDVEKVRAELETNFSQRLTAAQAQFEDRLVNVVHRGWKETVKTDDFKNWYAAQPDEIKALGNSERAEDAIAILDAFKEAKVEKPSIQNERTRRLESAARAPKTTSTSRPKSTANMSESERRAYDIAAGYNDD